MNPALYAQANIILKSVVEALNQSGHKAEIVQDVGTEPPPKEGSDERPYGRIAGVDFANVINLNGKMAHVRFREKVERTPGVSRSRFSKDKPTGCVTLVVEKVVQYRDYYTLCRERTFSEKTPGKGFPLKDCVETIVHHEGARQREAQQREQSFQGIQRWSKAVGELRGEFPKGHFLTAKSEGIDIDIHSDNPEEVKAIAEVLCRFRGGKRPAEKLDKYGEEDL